MAHSHHTRTHCLQAALLAALGLAPSAWAQQTFWQHDPRTPGDWFDPANWSQGIPSPKIDAVINNAGTTLISDSSPTARNLFLGSPTWGTGIGGHVRQTGGNATFDYLDMATLGGSASYHLQGGQLLVNYDLQLAQSAGTAQFIQEDGSSSIIRRALRLGQVGEGTYELRGGELTTGSLTVQHGAFRHLAGTHTTGDVVLNAPYTLQSGSLSSRKVTLASTELAFQQTGGTVHIDTSLDISYGTYALESGTLSADTQTLKTLTYNNQTHTGILRQTGGANATNVLDVQSGARYELASGTLHIGRSMTMVGTLDFANGNATLDIGPQTIARWMPNTVTNTAQANLSIGPESLLIVPSGFDPASVFHTFNNQGLVHQSGTTLLINTDQTVRGIGAISDPVEVRGTLAATPSGKIDLSGPLTVSGGLVDLGTGKFRNPWNAASGISSGKLIATDEQHDSNSRFVQTGGEHITKSLRVSSNTPYELRDGQLTADTATASNFIHTGGNFTVQRTLGASTYDLSGQAQLSAGELSVTNLFRQSGGTSNLGTLTLSAYSSDATSTYELSGGQLAAYEERLGDYYDYGISLFRQTGGIHIASTVMLGGNPRSTHTYELSNGQFHADSLEIAYRYDFRGNGSVIQTGGTLTIDHLRIGNNGRFEFRGGTLSLGNDINVAGIFDLGGQEVNLTFGPATILDFGHGQLLNTQSASLHLGTDSLLVIPPGFDTASAFRSFSNAGLTHIGGTPLTLGPTQSFSGSGVLSDPVQVAGGSITVPAKGQLEFAGGLSVLSGGSISAQGTLVISGSPSSQTGGEIHAAHFALAHDFTQQGGTVDATLLSTSNGYDYGIYNLVDGELRTRDALIAQNYFGHFIQDGGTHRVTGTLTVHGDMDYKGLGYELNGGRLEANKLLIGTDSSDGRFRQTGGTNVIDTLLVGQGGDYSLAAGTLIVAEATLDGGSLGLTPAADLRVTRRLTLNQASHLHALGSATVRLLGANFENHQTYTHTADDLKTLNLFFEANTDRWSTLEVASQLRSTADPYLGNFALGTLTIGGETPGRLRLVDLFDNQPGPEGLYVDHLIMAAGSILDLNGIPLHYHTATLAPDAVILVPEPATTLLALAVLFGLRRQRTTT